MFRLLVGAYASGMLVWTALIILSLLPQVPVWGLTTCQRDYKNTLPSVSVAAVNSASSSRNRKRTSFTVPNVEAVGNLPKTQ